MPAVAATGSSSTNNGTAHHKALDEALEIALSQIAVLSGGKGKDRNTYSVDFSVQLTATDTIYTATLSR
jgi:hypothetical protein